MENAFAVIVAASLLIAYSHAESTRRPAVRVENGLMINNRAGYYFTMPEGWTLDSTSNFEDVKVIHPGSGTDFLVSYGRAHGTPTTYYFALLFSLEPPNIPWLTFGKGTVKMDGRDAMGFVGTREKDGKTVKEFIWVVLSGEYVYHLGATIDLTNLDERAPEVNRIFSSFSWGTPPHAP
jgi:hypothetical protein